MWSLKAVLKHHNAFNPLSKPKMFPGKPHWGFSYSTVHHTRDDTSIATEIKVPILKAFHRHSYDRDRHISCGTKEYKVLMDNFHHVSNAFLKLNKRYQEVLENTIKNMGAGMAKFICKEIETVDDYEEYCHHVAGLIVMGLSRLFHASEAEILFPDSLSNSVGLFLQKTNIIIDYLEDINEIPKSRMFWPREIWIKYVNNLEDLKYEQNSEKAVQCLNEMVTNALIHIDDCLNYMSQLRDPAIFRFFAIPQVIAIADLALCYNNIEVFRDGVKTRLGLRAQVIDRTKTMADVYGAFYEFSSILKSKVDINDPNAEKTISRIEAVQKACRDSGTLHNRKSYVDEIKPTYNRAF
ncbi:squalene synthase [Artemisia annua]|uniref:Squalene synthase n=1 Tax=Artemisia annua TaxID=35608 RepID=A0A2U1P755_ARTAN|nr:squalene synthase [Artemisia annua]